MARIHLLSVPILNVIISVLPYDIFLVVVLVFSHMCPVITNLPRSVAA